MQQYTVKLEKNKQMDLFLQNFICTTTTVLICVKQITQPKTVLGVSTLVAAVWEAAQPLKQMNAF